MTDPIPNPPPGYPEGFTANSFTPAQEQAYLHIFRSLVREAEARPGFNMLRSMIAERTAHTFSRLKAYDTETQIYPPDYDRTSKTFSELVNRLLTAAKDGDDDDTRMQLFGRDVGEAAVRAIEVGVENGDITEDVASSLYKRLSANLHEAMENAR